MSVIPQEVDAQPEVSAPGKGSGRRIPGEPGVWIFIFGEMAVFLLLIIFYAIARFNNVESYREAQGAVNMTIGTVNTFVLLISSLLVIIGVNATRRGLPKIGPWVFGGALACGALFIVLKAFEYKTDIDHGMKMDGNNFGTWYFVLTGDHLLHVVLGMGFVIFMIVESRKKNLTPEQFGYVEGGACFWHMVDLIWLVIFPLLYFMR